MTLVVRTDGVSEQVIPAVRAELRQIDPEISLADVHPMTKVLSALVADRRLDVQLVGSFALLAIVLATVGRYGLIAHDVLQRTREIGIRLALGATRGSVLSMVMRRGLALVGIGVSVGLAAAAALTGSVSGLLFQV